MAAEPGAATAQGFPIAVTLAWAYDDPGIVHLRPTGTEQTLCGVRALTANLTRRAVTCEDCKRLNRERRTYADA